MDIYTSYTPTPGPTELKLIDSFESLIWTDRFSSHGDFKLTVKENYYFNNLRFYQYLFNSETATVMMIETVDTPREVDGEKLVTVSGRSFEAFLQFRNNKSGAARDPEEFLGTIPGIARWVVFKYCVNAATAGAVNVIPSLEVAPVIVPRPVVQMLPDRTDIYSLVKAICDTDNLGFAIYRQEEKLVFYVYEGIDKTDPSTSYYQIFSQDNETLYDISTLESISNYKNHARVLGAKTGADVYLPGTAPTVSGLERRTLVVEATDIGSSATETDPEKITSEADDKILLKQRGLEALFDSANRFQRLIDGSIPQNKWNVTSFGLGDLVMVKDTYGVKQKLRIAESIWTVDRTGTYLNPTFEQLD